MNVGSIISASGFRTYLALKATTYVITMLACKAAVFSKEKFDEIDIQFVNKMKKLGKWIKTSVEKVLNLVPGLSRRKSVQNEQNMDNSRVTNQDDNEIVVLPGTAWYARSNEFRYKSR